MIIITTLLLVLMHTLIASSNTYVIHEVYVFNLNGEITDVTYDELQNAMQLAESTPNSALLIILETPGGELDAALNIVSSIESASIPVIGFVYPTGSYSWSAGTLVLLSTTIAAMAPSTVIGSCQPVEINPITGQEEFINESKILNAISQYFVEVAEFRGRNATFAHDCVFYNTNLGPEDALKYKVINFIATDVDSLLNEINGSTINGVTYYVINPTITYYQPGIGYQVYEVLINSTIQDLLSGLGLLLAIVGFAIRHYYLAGVGILLMLIPLLTGLSINWLGLALLIIGLAAIAIDVHAGFTTHAALFITGIVLTVLGIVLLQPTYTPQSWLIATNQVEARIVLYSLVAFVGGFGGFIAAKVIGIIRTRPLSERLYLPVNDVGVAVDDINKDEIGYVKVRGEYWRAKALESVRRGSRVIIVGIDGDTLLVKPVG
ncbi:nodulation protein NfeD [Vulcanisaeta moutnovskia 768-28]|uniref:Nodulation protein NfeD n=1 Tax=Vulcanisaeta moutnovskia (strain 768-28) TaxID=985053 RepID=F0QUE9_VULM7|nr:nodulation protein NfeD [Vulcanisaeta moutnovskia 768-28]